MRPQNPHMPLCLFHPQLTQSEMDSYVDIIPPSCQLELHLQRTEQPYERLVHHIKVTGIQGTKTYQSQCRTKTSF